VKISRVRIKKFRNFKDLDVILGEHAVIVGENKIGKTNFLHALRLVLDPSLPDTARQLQESDFWDGLPRPLTKEDVIIISPPCKQVRPILRLPLPGIIGVNFYSPLVLQSYVTFQSLQLKTG